LSIIKDGRLEITGSPQDIKAKLSYDYNFQVQINECLSFDIDHAQRDI